MIYDILGMMLLSMVLFESEQERFLGVWMIFFRACLREYPFEVIVSCSFYQLARHIFSTV